MIAPSLDPDSGQKISWWKRFWRVQRVDTPSDDDFLPRNYRLLIIRLSFLIEDQPERPQSELEAKLLQTPPRAADWSDLYAMDLAVIRRLPEQQLEMEIYNVKQRYLDIVGKLPEFWVSIPQSKAPQPTSAKAEPLATGIVTKTDPDQGVQS